MGMNIKKIKKDVLFIKSNSYFYVKIILFVNEISNNNYIYLFILCINKNKNDNYFLFININLY